VTVSAPNDGCNESQLTSINSFTSRMMKRSLRNM